MNLSPKNYIPLLPHPPPRGSHPLPLDGKKNSHRPPLPLAIVWRGAEGGGGLRHGGGEATPRAWRQGPHRLVPVAPLGFWTHRRSSSPIVGITDDGVPKPKIGIGDPVGPPPPITSRGSVIGPSSWPLGGQRGPRGEAPLGPVGFTPPGSFSPVRFALCSVV